MWRYPVFGSGPLRRAETTSRRSSRSIRSPPNVGAPRGDDSQRRGCAAVPTPFGGEEPTSSQGRPGRAAAVRCLPRACPWLAFQPTLAVETPRGGDGPCGWNSSSLLPRHSVRWHLRMWLVLREQQGFRARWAAGDRQPRSSRWVSRPSGAVAYPRRVPRRWRLVLAEWCCFRVFAQAAWAHFGGVAAKASKTRHRIAA